MKKETIVLGLGNPLMADEGIGIKLVQLLTSACGENARADFVDAGTGGMSVLHYIANRKKAIIIDCALMNTEPGTIKRFTPDQVKTVKELSHLSLHEVDILKVIELSKQLGECPEQIIFFGIEPETIEQRAGLSDLLTKKLDDYIEMISKELVV
jgi:hydrogenase maturation protease